ncbi:MAG: selenide, water dikinase SelD, partial [Pseudomonadota bacterium]
EMTVGFTVTGLSETAPITLEGARPGDALVLTKPIGSGVVMAAEMAAEAQGADVAQAYQVMMQPQGIAARHLRAAHAMTDVTGFGLAGHVMNMVLASAVGAEIDLDTVPVMAGALALSERGVRSSLFAQNKAVLPDVEETAQSALLFDPQTSGGLLAALGGDADAVVARLRVDGYDAAVIGRITDKTGQVSID